MDYEMMIFYAKLGGGVVLTSLFLVLVVLNIINYRKSKRAYLKSVELRNKNLVTFRQIMSQLELVEKRYDKYVHTTLSAKIFYIMNKIRLFEGLEKQNSYLKKTNDRLYESIARLNSNYYDVLAIITPLNNLLKEIEGELRENPVHE